ncbi:MAG TPA: hypothetical protein VHW09_14285 [Bryobacteraceae bacterium]|nr:hypothetical protein [Bryobacteraceae bacterium]
MKRLAARDGGPYAISGGVTIASALHAAAPAHALVAAFRPVENGDSGSSSPFASQLNGLTQAAGDDNDRATPLPKTPLPQTVSLTKLPAPPAATPLPATLAGSPQQQSTVLAVVFALPRPASKPLEGSRTTPLLHGKHTASTQTPIVKTEEPNQTATLAVVSAPVPEIAAPTTQPAEPSADQEDSDIAAASGPSPAAPQEAPQAAPPPETAAPATPPPAPEMAFAARVQSAADTDRSTLPAEMASASAVASANKKVVAAAQDEAAAPAETHAMAATAAATVERVSTPPTAGAPAAHSAAPVQRAEAPAAVNTENSLKPATPLKDISMQVNQPGKERVEVRVVQQGSEVHVSVHSADATLNSGLRQGLSELQSRLEENGYRSEMWRPGVATAPVAAAASAQAPTNHSRGGEGQPQHGGSQQESGRRNQNQSNQPRWVEEMESSLDAGTKSTGGFYGFGS